MLVSSGKTAKIIVHLITELSIISKYINVIFKK